MNTPVKDIARARVVAEAWKHLSNTQLKSLDDIDNCTYGGSGCAIAPSIIASRRTELDQEFNPYYVEGTSASDVGVEFFHDWAKPLVGDSFLDKLQKVHDNLHYESGEYFVREFARSLTSFCDKHNVEVPESLYEYNTVYEQ